MAFVGAWPVGTRVAETRRGAVDARWRMSAARPGETTRRDVLQVAAVAALAGGLGRAAPVEALSMKRMLAKAGPEVEVGNGMVYRDVSGDGQSGYSDLPVKNEGLTREGGVSAFGWGERRFPSARASPRRVETCVRSTTLCTTRISRWNRAEKAKAWQHRRLALPLARRAGRDLSFRA